ncbi:hypothetical protein EGW08_000931 [Elysia chlorotica]|uniref:Uncharacterized protein n=1 Tax=Elysia chlorotica TaxID=188477 RepID=A0A3S1BLQ1_ELYCH|nr:hypothetical protein EGW08_000931 [Elysia chlorotica]
MDFPRKCKTKRKNPGKTLGLPKLDTLTQLEREQLYHQNFQELAALRRNVYSSLNIHPRNTYLPPQLKPTSVVRPSQQEPQKHQESASGTAATHLHQPQRDQASGAITTYQQQPQQQKQQRDLGIQRHDEQMQINKKQKHAPQYHHQQQHKEPKQHGQFREGSNTVMQSGLYDRSEKAAMNNGKDLSENRNYFNTPGRTNGASYMPAFEQEKPPPQPEIFVKVDEGSDSDFSSMMDTDSSEYERF